MLKQVILGLSILGAAAAANARDTINIVGSSTVYPFATTVAEQFGKGSGFKTPKIESTGSGGGFKLFCEGVDLNTPDISNASRAIKKSEIEKCSKNGVKEIVQVKIGYDGIVIANSNHGPTFNLSLRDVYLALAEEIPNPNGTETFIPNPFKRWNEVNTSLPNEKIEVLGPPPTSGTRDAFVELAMQGGANTFPWVKALKKKDKGEYKAKVHTIREDGAFIEAGENDNLIVQKLQTNPVALGVFGFSFLDQNTSVIKGAHVNGVEPEFETISDGSYPLSRPLFFYVKKAHIGKVPGIQEYANEFMSEKAAGEDGYLASKGLIPLPEKEYAETVDIVSAMKPMQ